MISDLMLEDHKKIQIFLSELQQEQTLEKFKRFQWALERHFLIEENAILKQFRDVDSSDEVMQILDEHDKMLKVLHEIAQSRMKHKSEIYELSEMLKKHSAYEDQHVYPMLDRTLSLEERENIVNKIDEINELLR